MPFIYVLYVYEVVRSYESGLDNEVFVLTVLHLDMLCAG